MKMEKGNTYDMVFVQEAFLHIVIVRLSVKSHFNPPEDINVTCNIVVI